MLTPETKARIWLWWPYLAGLVLLVLVIGGASFFLLKDNGQSDELEKSVRQQLREMSNVPAFRTAYLAANGGEQRVTALQSILSSGTLESGGTSIAFRTIKRRPDKSITTLIMPDYDLSFVVNGEQVWQRVEQPGLDPVVTLKEGKEADAMRDMGDFFDPLMQVVVEKPENILSIIPNVWKGQSCLLIQLNTPDRGTETHYYVDPVQMTPIARVENFARGQKREVFFSDYRLVEGGIMEPFKTETYLDGKLQNRVFVEKYVANPGVISSIFEYTDDAEGIRTTKTPAVEAKQ